MPPPITMAPDDLSEAERFMVLAAGRGETVDLKRHTVRASIVRDLALEARPGWSVPDAGLRIHKAIIDGVFDLEGCTLAKPLMFWHSRFQGGGDKGAMILRDGKLKRLGIHSSTVEGGIIADRVEIENGFFLGGGLVKGVLQIRGGIVDGALAIEGTEIGDGKSALLAAGLHLRGPLILRRAQIKGEVSFPRAELSAGIYAEDAVIVREGLAVNGESARIQGDVLLDRANITGSLRFVNARIGGQLSADGLVVAATPNAILASGITVAQSVNVSGAKIAGSVWLEGAEIAKMFRAEGVEIWGEETAIGADVIRIGGNWDLARAKINGVMSCPGAEINGQLRMTEARLMGRDVAIRGDGARIRGGCFLSRSTILGLVRVPAAEIGNQFRLRGATLKVDRGPALLASGSTFHRDVELNDGFQATGALVFDQAVVGGMLDLSGSRVSSIALSGLARAPVAISDQPVQAGDDQVSSIALSLIDAKVDRLAMPARAEDRPRGIVDLSRAHVGSYADFAAAWPPPPVLRGRSLEGRDIDHIVLDGFTYEHLSNPSGIENRPGTSPAYDDRVGTRRVAWLEGQEDTDLRDHFKPQAWVQLASRLSAQGYHDDARTIHIARRRRELSSASTRAHQRWQGRILDLFALYGYNPWRTVLWMAVLVLAFAGVWSWAASNCREAGCLDESVFVVANRDAYTPETFAKAYPPFNALAYSFDVFVPFVSFGYEDHWRPNIAWQPFADVPLPDFARVSALILGHDGAVENQSHMLQLTMGGVLYVLVVIEMLLGLVLASLAVTGFTGLLRGQD